MLSTPFLTVPPAKYGGTERVVYELVEGLAARGHEVTLFATGDSRTSADLRALYPNSQWPPRQPHLTDINHTTWAMSEVKRGRYEVVHAHSPAALACGRFVPRTPLVYTVHHARDESWSSYYRFFPDVYYVAISAEQARREIPLKNVVVINHGLDESRYQWSETADTYVCFLGRFAEVKGPHTAIDVAAQAGLPIRVAGETHDIDVEFSAREMRHRLQQEHVTMLGSVGMAEKVPLLRNARALLSPITWEEPFGLALIEAMLSGCPVVAYRRGSAEELVENGITGFLVRTQEEMVHVIRLGGPVERFDRKRCREVACSRFGRTRMVDAHERLYRRAIQGARRKVRAMA